MKSLHNARHLLGCVVMTAALFLSAGGHLAFLQGVAWATMIRDYSLTGSVTAAVEKTFDGKHPCPLCKKIAAQRSHDEKAPVTVKAEKKAEVFLGSATTLIPLPVVGSFAYPPHPFLNAPEHTSAPPVPVPIAA
jgi:ssDNA-binding Zn-finger/Zn-ribbon topoisomerase 1